MIDACKINGTKLVFFDKTYMYSQNDHDLTEETIAGRKKELPFNLKVAIKVRRANLKKAFIPMTSNVEVDDHFITGHNPFSSKEMTKIAFQQLEGK